MTESWWLEVAKQVPALIIYVFTVMQFLKYMGERDKSYNETQEKVAEKIAVITQEAKEFQRALLAESREIHVRAVTVIDKNIEFLSKNVYALEKVTPPAR
jgi:cation transport regulator ChaC